MRDGLRAAHRVGWFERAAVAALVVAAVAALSAACRLGAAAGARGDSLLAELRALTERRVAAERAQIGPVLDAAARGELTVARREAEEALAGLEGNSQLHLLLAGVYRANGAAAPAVREYRRAVELVRDYADRRSPHYIGATLAPWLHEVRPALSGEALGNLNFLARALAGGCS